LSDAGWKLADTPLGRDDADSAYVPETVPIAANVTPTASLEPGATMSGCAMLIVSLPEEGPVLADEVPVGPLVVELIDVAVGCDPIIGIVT
jgi:hypothetical protein